MLLANFFQWKRMGFSLSSFLVYLFRGGELRKNIKDELLKKTFRKTNNNWSQKGAALMLALSFVALISFVLFEISKETLFESLSTSQDIHELRAYYAARAGEDISLLRIKTYHMVISQIEAAGPMAAPFKEKASILWEFPFIWPPILPDTASLVAKNQLNVTLKESFFKKVAFAPVIQDLGGLIDLNALDSPSESLAESTRTMLIEIYRKKIEDDEEFSSNYSYSDIERVINNITDWIDEDSESLSGGSESSSYASRDLRNIPPNQHFKSLDEVLLVEGMSSELFDVIKDSITIIGSPGININTANKRVLRTLDPRLTDELIDKIIQDRQNPDHGPYNENLFKGFIESELGDFSEFNPHKIPIFYSAMVNFKIESIGSSGKIIKTIETYVYDESPLIKAMVEGLKSREEKEKAEEGEEGEEGEKEDEDSQNSKNQKPTEKKSSSSQEWPPGPPPILFRKVF